MRCQMLLCSPTLTEPNSTYQRRAVGKSTCESEMQWCSSFTEPASYKAGRYSNPGRILQTKPRHSLFNSPIITEPATFCRSSKGGLQGLPQHTDKHNQQATSNGVAVSSRNGKEPNEPKALPHLDTNLSSGTLDEQQMFMTNPGTPVMDSAEHHDHENDVWLPFAHITCANTNRGDSDTSANTGISNRAAGAIV